MNSNLTAAVNGREPAAQSLRPKAKKSENDEFSGILSVIANSKYFSRETGRLGSAANIIRDIQANSSAESREKRLSDLFKRETQSFGSPRLERQEAGEKEADLPAQEAAADKAAEGKTADDWKTAAEAKRTAEIPAEILALLKNSKTQMKGETASAAQNRTAASAVSQLQAEALRQKKDHDIKTPAQDSLKQGVKEASVRPEERSQKVIHTGISAGGKQEISELLSDRRDVKKQKLQKDARLEPDSLSREAGLQDAPAKKGETAQVSENAERKNLSVKVKELKAELHPGDDTGLSGKNDSGSVPEEAVKLSADKKRSQAEGRQVSGEKTPVLSEAAAAEKSGAEGVINMKRQEHEAFDSAARKESFFTVNASKFDLKKDMNSGDSRRGAGNPGDMGASSLRAGGQKNLQESRGAKFSSVYRYQNERQVDKKDIFDQIVKNAKISVDSGKTDMKIQLKPDFLGKMELKVVLENGSITAKITTESADLKNLISVSLDELKEILAAGGLDVASVDVQLAGGESFSGGDFSESGGAHRPAYRGQEEVSSEPAAPESREYGMYWRNTTVNYII